ncbi:MAG: 2-amino-4-hydroxy-6-hydroxymethyldihydropteridine diphosphokinase [Clostridiales bacterium]|nr:2-amino-4-hydroxy-6-hydroxymethyldihydropteridine diphosphokinase [Clostridiales bacterium]
MEYILSLGTNMGDRQLNIERCINAINLTPYTDVIKCSDIYETQPVGYLRQQNFYNCVLQVKSCFNEHEMLGVALGIESGFGRERGIADGPRIIDVDILLAEDLKIDSPNLKLPHPRMFERRFVLRPMLDLFPSGEAYGINFKKHLDKIEGQGVKPLKKHIDIA